MLEIGQEYGFANELKFRIIDISSEGWDILARNITDPNHEFDFSIESPVMFNMLDRNEIRLIES